jgi:hypothetical protein
MPWPSISGGCAVTEVMVEIFMRIPFFRLSSTIDGTPILDDVFFRFPINVLRRVLSLNVHGAGSFVPSSMDFVVVAEVDDVMGFGKNVCFF